MRGPRSQVLPAPRAPHPLSARPRLPSRLPQERHHPRAAAPVPAGPAHPGSGGASSCSQSKSGAPTPARVRWRLRARAPQAASQEEASIGRRVTPASSARVSMLQPPAEANPGTSLPPLAFPPEQTEVKKHSAFRLGRLQFQDQPLLVQWGKNQVPKTRMRAPASFSNAVPSLPGKSSRTEHALRRPLGLRKELCAGAGRDWRERRPVFRRWSEEVAGGVDDGCLAAREGWSFEESPSSGRSGAVAAGELEALLPSLAVPAVDAVAFPPTADPGRWVGPCSWGFFDPHAVPQHVVPAGGGCVDAGSWALAGGGLHGVTGLQCSRGAVRTSPCR